MLPCSREEKDTEIFIKNILNKNQPPFIIVIIFNIYILIRT